MLKSAKMRSLKDKIRESGEDMEDASGETASSSERIPKKRGRKLKAKTVEKNETENQESDKESGEESEDDET